MDTPQLNERSLAEVWSAAQHGRSLYGTLLLRRAYRAGRTWLRRRLGELALGGSRARALRIPAAASSPRG